MAISSTAIIDIRNGGSDTLNGGLFNPGATLTADGAATSATGNSPVFTSASYNFVAGDVGAWLFIKSGSNWTPGWYQIASVASNQATLSAAIGQAVLYSSTTGLATGFNTVAGCATTASPTSASWTVDYSQQTTVQNSLTSLTTAAANAVILTASATVAMIGNGIVITGGTNFTTGYYQINSVSAGVSITVDRTCTSAAGVSGTAGVGGALASPGMGGAVAPANLMFLKYNASAFIATSATINIASGCVGITNNYTICGYDTSRWLFNTDTNRPTYQVGSAVSAATLITTNGGGVSGTVANIIFDGNSQTTSRGVNLRGTAWNCKFTACTNGGYVSNNSSSGVAVFCDFSACTTQSACQGGASFCRADSCTATPFNGTDLNAMFAFCIASSNTGASTDGFTITTNGHLTNCVAYASGRDGYRISNSQHYTTVMTNCVAENNAGWGFNITTTPSFLLLKNCASYNNTSGRATGTGLVDALPITGSSSFFVNAASGNFAPNATAAAGILLRGLGFPATFPAGLTASYADIGAAQHADPTPPLGQIQFVRNTGVF